MKQETITELKAFISIQKILIEDLKEKLTKSESSANKLAEALEEMKKYVSETNHSDFWKEHPAGIKTKEVLTTFRGNNTKDNGE